MQAKAYFSIKLTYSKYNLLYSASSNKSHLVQIDLCTHRERIMIVHAFKIDTELLPLPQRTGYGKHQYRPCPHAKIEVPISSNFFCQNYLFNTHNV